MPTAIYSILPYIKGLYIKTVQSKQKGAIPVCEYIENIYIYELGSLGLKT